MNDYKEFLKQEISVWYGKELDLESYSLESLIHLLECLKGGIERIE